MHATIIYCKTGIYDTQYTIRDYGAKIVVTEPYVRWENNSGSLDFRKTTITNPKTMIVIRGMAESEELVNDDQEVLQDILDGNYHHLPLSI
jgi:hypothetical protein